MRVGVRVRVRVRARVRVRVRVRVREGAVHALVEPPGFVDGQPHLIELAEHEPRLGVHTGKC